MSAIEELEKDELSETMARLNDARVGARAPDFRVQGTNGSVGLQELLAGHNLLIYFVREFGCHTCMSHAVELAKLQSELSITNTRSILIGGGSFEAATKIAQRYKLPYPCFGDADRSIYRTYGFERAMLLIQKSGTVLIDRAGFIRHRHAGANPGASFDRTEILTQAGKLLKTST